MSKRPCDSCRKFNICNPGPDFYVSACQWKDAEGKQNLPRDNWGITSTKTQFNSESREDGWVAIRWSVKDVDQAIEDHEMHFEPTLTSDEKMDLLETMLKGYSPASGANLDTIAFLLVNMYGDRLVDDLEESA